MLLGKAYRRSVLKKMSILPHIDRKLTVKRTMAGYLYLQLLAREYLASAKLKAYLANLATHVTDIVV